MAQKGVWLGWVQDSERCGVQYGLRDTRETERFQGERVPRVPPARRRSLDSAYKRKHSRGVTL